MNLWKGFQSQIHPGNLVNRRRLIEFKRKTGLIFLITTFSSEEEEVQFVPHSKQPKFNNMGMEFAGMRSKSLGGGAKGFERYGIGAKLLAGMGFEPGKGLGKDLQGISAPIEAHVRQGRGAIGLYGKEKKTAPAESVISQPKVAKESATPGTSHEPKWQKVNKTKEKVEYKYLTAEEVLEQKQMRVRPDAGHLAKVKVLDMTGPEQRILSGYHAISAGQHRPQEWSEESTKREEEGFNKFLARKPAFDIPELVHNVELLRESCEYDIFKNDKKAKYASDRKAALAEEMEDLTKTVAEEEVMIAKMEKIMTQMQSICNSTNLDMDNAYVLLGKLKRDFEEEWELYQLYALIPAVTIPLIKDALKVWKPLEMPQYPLQILNDWATLLGSQTEQYEIILWETWMPCIRQANSAWTVKNAEPMVRLIQFWKPLLPPWLVDIIFDQLLVPTLSQAVEDWDPLSDVVPIHAWIHPWLPHLGSKLEIVYPTIRAKLANALGRWHPSDVSAKQILTPWITVFSKGSMDTFLMKNIVPKLQLAMQELIINPIHQVLDPWNWVMEWLDMIPDKSIINILETMFFPKWLQFLAGWLNQIPHYDDVRQWYLWWRGLFKEQLMRDPVVMGMIDISLFHCSVEIFSNNNYCLLGCFIENLQKGLEIIGAAMQRPGQPIDFSYILNRSSAQRQAQQPTSSKPQELMVDAIRLTSQVPHGFKELVQMKCEELGLIFIPVPNRYYEGKQVYKCGSVLIYISANVIFLQRNGAMWIPVSLNQLIQAASS